MASDTVLPLVFLNTTCPPARKWDELPSCANAVQRGARHCPSWLEESYFWTHTHNHRHTHICTDTHTHVHTHTHTHTYTHTHTHTLTLMCRFWNTKLDRKMSSCFPFFLLTGHWCWKRQVLRSELPTQGWH